MTNRKYYTLITRDDIQAPWCIAFGDYDRACVDEEREDHFNHGWTIRNTRIITTSDKQADIDNAVLCINAAR